MNDGDDIKQKVDEKLADTMGQIVAQARARDYEEANLLLRAHHVSFGIGMLIIGTGVIGFAAIFHGSFPYAMPIILGIAVALWIIGAFFIDLPNWRRKRLARRLLNRSSRR